MLNEGSAYMQNILYSQISNNIDTGDYEELFYYNEYVDYYDNYLVKFVDFSAGFDFFFDSILVYSLDCFDFICMEDRYADIYEELSEFESILTRQNLCNNKLKCVTSAPISFY